VRVVGGSGTLLVWWGRGCGGRDDNNVMSIGGIMWWVLLRGVSEVVECIIEDQHCWVVVQVVVRVGVS